MASSVPIDEVLYDDGRLRIEVAHDRSPTAFEWVFLPVDKFGVTQFNGTYTADILRLNDPRISPKSQKLIHTKGYITLENDNTIKELPKILTLIKNIEGRLRTKQTFNYLTAAIKEHAQELNTHSVWIPLMGRGTRDLELQLFAESTIKSLFGGKDTPRSGHFLICLPYEFGEEDLPILFNALPPHLQTGGDLRDIVKEVKESMENSAQSSQEPSNASVNRKFRKTNDDEPSELLTDIVAELNKTLKPLRKIKDTYKEDTLKKHAAKAIKSIGVEWDGELDETLLALLRAGPAATDESSVHADRNITKREDDALNRAPIADILAGNIANAWPEHRDKNWSFIVHISGRWGSGKSSVLSMLKENLTENPKYFVPADITPSAEKHPWIVADFNAWLEQSGDKTWWAILNSVKRALWPRPPNRPSWSPLPEGFSISDTRWRLWRRWKHWIISGIFLACITLLAPLVASFVAYVSTPKPEISHTVTITDSVDSSRGAAPSEAASPKKQEIHKTVKKYPVQHKNIYAILVQVLGALTTIAALFALFNRLSPRAQRTSDAIIQLDNKPLAPLTERYHQMVVNSKNPVAVFIDDLDRCDADYVVDVLQVLQTAYSKTPVLYVIAADRDWIVSAYEQKYGNFKDALSKPGQPLGYLFLKKIFQMSLTLPDLSDDAAEHYLNELVGDKEGSDDDALQKDTVPVKSEDSLTAPARDEVDPPKDPHPKDTDSAARLEKIVKGTKTEMKKNAPHRLTKYTDILEANPRSIKRLINAYGFKYLYNLIGEFGINENDLVIWSILELRFPFVAYMLLRKPELVTAQAREDANLTDEEVKLFEDPDIAAILGKLTPEVIIQMRDIS